jgi:hypothetical protein
MNEVGTESGRVGKFRTKKRTLICWLENKPFESVD